MDLVYEQEAKKWIEDVQTCLSEISRYEGVNKIKSPVFFITFLCIMLNSLAIPRDRAKLYGVATTLLKLGLDLHVEKQHPPLSVLSGDFLSISFYNMLSKNEEVEGIQYISKAISNLNKWKMEHYTSFKNQGLLNSVALKRIQKISSSLVLSLANFFIKQSDERELWNEIIQHSFLLYEAKNIQSPLTTCGQEFITLSSKRLESTKGRLELSIARPLTQLLQAYYILPRKEGHPFEISLS